jgi:hypothetical protein
MRPRPESLPNSCRLLQMVHAFDTWAGTPEEAIRTRIRQAVKAGIGGVVACVRSEDYLQDQKAWETLQRGVKIAHEEGLRVWIYDEDGYPSGTAGGLVLEKAPSAEAQGLIRVKDSSGAVRYDVIPLYEATHATENFYKKRHYINIMDPLAVKTFLAVTHDRYAAALEPISRYVEAFFTDEPSLIAVYIPTGREYPKTLPWHSRLPEEFRARKGYDLLEFRENLFVDTAAADTDRKIRCDFYDVIADLCAETYFGGLQEWCHSHNIASSGHLLGEEKMVWQLEFDGDPFTSYRKFDIPGIDMITSDPEKIMSREFFLVPKIAGSAARLQGKKRVMCEISDFFGMMNNTHASMTQMQCTAGILFSCGVTDLCSYYSASLDPGHELNKFEFSVKEYSQYTDYTARLNSVFTDGTIQARVAVVYPIVSVWSHFTPSNRSMYEDHPSPDVRYLDNAFLDFCRSLLQHQIDYDIVDEKSVGTAKVRDGRLIIGERQYEALALPPMDTIRRTTLAQIIAFSGSGGSVFVHSLHPLHVADVQEDGQTQELLRRLHDIGAHGGSMAGSPPVSYLVTSRIPPTCELFPASPDILHTVILGEKGENHFFVNTSSKGYEGTCVIRGEHDRILYDPSSGIERGLRLSRERGSAQRFELHLRPFESLFIL